MNMVKNIVAVSLVATLIGACASNYDRSPRENAVRGAVAGAAVGAGVGAVSSKEHRGRNALIGAGVGGTTGAIAGAR